MPADNDSVASLPLMFHSISDGAWANNAAPEHGIVVFHIVHEQQVVHLSERAIVCHVAVAPLKPAAAATEASAAHLHKALGKESR